MRGGDTSDSGERDDARDVVILGSGAGGMVAAIATKAMGLDVLLLEKTSLIGGTTALSGGAIWIPDVTQGNDSEEDVIAYLASNVGDDRDISRWKSFVASGPQMIDFLARETQLRLVRHAGSPDYHPTLPGGKIGGRRLDPQPFDGRLLGEHFNELRAPLRAFSVFGGMMVNIADIGHLLAAHRSVMSLVHSISILGRYAVDRLRWRRGTRLLLGNALAARLFRSMLDANVDYIRNADVTDLIKEDGRVTGVEFRLRGVSHRVLARRGVVLATGGFASGEEVLRRFTSQNWKVHSVAPEGNTGDGVVYGEKMGGAISSARHGAGFWAPVSRNHESDGSVTIMPHFVWDRQKPGIIAVNTAGRRFVNEARSYHVFVQAMTTEDEQNNPAFLICDHATIRKWGLGLVHAGWESHQPYRRSGYLQMGNTLDELAANLGIESVVLKDTVRRYNGFSATGCDEDFHKGSDEYQRHLGDPRQRPNPNIGALHHPPFYGIRLEPGIIGTATGLNTDAQARVLSSDGAVIPGLYACGNDMASIMSGTYPGPGITLGPAMVFGYIAARHLATEEW